MNPIDFYFDFSSPYGYLASELIDDLAAKHGRQVQWHPYLMGAALKRTGRAPLVNYDLVSGYATHDISRSARLYGLRVSIPSKFPVASIAACRAFYAINNTSETDAKKFASAIYRAYFVDDRDIQTKQVVLEITEDCGHDTNKMAAALDDPGIKEKLRQVTDDAIEAGVFGSPFIIVDGEPFWGSDRLSQIDQWLETGGW